MALASRIETEIADGAVASGTRLGTKRDLCDRYGVSYGTLNEAIRVLQHRGYVTTMGGPNGGLFASAPTAMMRLGYMQLGYSAGASFQDIVMVRRALDEAVALDAARCRGDADLRDLRFLVDALRDVANDPAEYLRRNWAFHRRLADTCRNAILRNLYCTLLDANEAGLRAVVPDPRFVQRVKVNMAAHEELIAAVASQSTAAVKIAVAKHAASQEDADTTEG